MVFICENEPIHGLKHGKAGKNHFPNYFNSSLLVSKIVRFFQKIVRFFQKIVRFFQKIVRLFKKIVRYWTVVFIYENEPIHGLKHGKAGKNHFPNYFNPSILVSKIVRFFEKIVRFFQKIVRLFKKIVRYWTGGFYLWKRAHTWAEAWKSREKSFPKLFQPFSFS